MLRSFVLCVGAWAALSASVSAKDLPKVEPEAVGLSSAKLEDLKKHFQGYVDSGKLAGLTTLVARQGKVAHFETYGDQDIAAGKAMGDEAVFRIYSMTKPITTAALMMLWEEGKFSLDDPVSKYLPSFADQRVFAGQDEDGFKTVPANREATILDLMRHTAGLSYGVFSDTPVDRSYRKNGVFSFGADDSIKTLTEKLGKEPLLYQPGGAWVYSLSVDVQGRLIEVLSGMELDEFFSKRIFKPLGMDDTGFYAEGDEQSRLVEMYALDEKKALVPYKGEFWQDFTVQPGVLSGGGGLVSTTEDYWRFSQMIANGGELDGVRLLKEKTVAMMRTNQLPGNLNGIAGGKQGLGFGLGFAVVQDPSVVKGQTNIGNYFWGGMANTIFWIDPKEELVVILMTNVLPSGIYPLRKDMRNKVYDALVH
ncbi:beta-lactamase family protein [Kordiimonas sp. SCSIO 12603]|uniref:serine hydrolase domain-containing protein n=1 Tax=Kordiimonas sp. SCSIO 12603 TaxID=2829596 RepID=UPI0021055D68|nr:serine hydrolase domain-containing protein [Kordiimonas sp. SCSIO 12603]UTW58463.1 beta-lactamase family protein [Kordiimonas sp. SCSIO 12603]